MTSAHDHWPKWLHRIVRDEAESLPRQRRAAGDPEPAGHIGEDHDTRSLAERAAFARLQADLNNLSQHQRAALVLHEVTGLAHTEIAEVLDCSTNAAKQAIFEARSALAQMTEGRAMRCETVQKALSDADGRVLRGSSIRSHLRDCQACSTFRTTLQSRSRDIAALFPALPGASATAFGGAVGKSIAVVAATAMLAGGAATTKTLLPDNHKTPSGVRTTTQAEPVGATKAGLKTRVRGASGPSRLEANTSAGGAAPQAAAAPPEAAPPAAVPASAEGGKTTTPDQIKKVSAATEAAGKAIGEAKANVTAIGRATTPALQATETTLTEVQKISLKDKSVTP